MRRSRRWLVWIGVWSAALACGDSQSTQSTGSTEWATPPEAVEEAEAPPLPAGTPPPPPLLFPRGLIANEAGVTPGFVLFNPLLSDTALLVNNEGEIVHTWKTSYSPGGGMYLLESGNLLRTGRDPQQTGFKAGGTGGVLQELDWDGNVVWEWRLSDDGRVQHHDIEPMPNGNILAIAWEVKTPEQARRAGRRVDQTPERGLWPDWVLEIEPVRDGTGGGDGGANVVWEWHVWDHLIQDRDPAAANHGDPAAHPERLDINAGSDAPEISAEELAQLQALGYVPEETTAEDLRSDFLHTNSIDYHARLDQIALSIPSLGEIWIIDHGTTREEARGPRGDLLYRWGNPAAYGRGGAQQLFYQHDVRWIPDGWEGAGNLTLFNNGGGRPDGSYSSIDEWTPPVGPNGRYPVADGEPWGPAELAWQYKAEGFFSPFISGAHRLANGNTMICSGTGGRFMEVTPDGELVWEYRNPFSGDVRNADGTLPQPGLDQSPYAVFRAT
ncbi:MAG: aryl-sulfate sulfotransferase, partial [Proteobacteria bacterium]|nr:aryl-sulfate sulfotransferase [Pseudomonadota bacterium]